MSLARLEQDFQDCVLSGVSAGIENNGANAGPKNNSAAGIGAARIGKHIVGTARVPIATRLAIYSDAYRARLAEALENNYPMLVKLLGTCVFNDLAGAYIDRHRSAHFSIRWYGDRLSALLAGESPYKERPILAELADWEWNMTLAFDAADVPPLTRAALAGLTPEEWPELQFKAHPSLKLLCMNTNAPLVWRALNRNEEPPSEAAACDAASLPNWIIWRRELDTFFRSLEVAEARALQAAIRGEPFAMVCEELAQEVGEQRAAGDAAQFLALWLQDGLLAA